MALIRQTWVAHWEYQKDFSSARGVPDRQESRTGLPVPHRLRTGVVTPTSVAHWRYPDWHFNCWSSSNHGYNIFFSENYTSLYGYSFLKFSVRIISLKQKKWPQLNIIYQNFVFGVVFDIHWLKLGCALQKTIPRGWTISSFFGGLDVFSAGALGSDQTSHTLESFLIRPYRLWKELCSDSPQNYPDPRPRSDQTVQIPCRIWMRSWSDYPDRTQWCQTLWSGRALPPVRHPSRSALGWLESRTSSRVIIRLILFLRLLIWARLC